MNIVIKPIYEFLLWDNCSNNCLFCFQRKDPRIFSLQQQDLILNQVINFLDSDEYIINSHVLLVGGELFDVLQRNSFLEIFFKKITSYLINKKIDNLYLNTNLLYNNECISFLEKILDLFHKFNLFERLHFTTSYDIYGRFRTIESKDLFLKNLVFLRKRFPNMKIIVNMILTKQLCQNILNSVFDIFDFKQKYQVNINLIPYIILNNDLTASRDQIVKVFSKIRSIDEKSFINQIAEYDLKQQRKMYYYKENKWISCECELNKCGHSINFTRYSNNKSCFVCDMKRLFGVQ